MPRAIVNARVTVQVVTWNSLTHLPFCLDAVGHQAFQPVQIMLMDNASADGTVRWLEEHYPQVNLLRNTRNYGFCRAHNQGIRLSRADYVLLLNPDVILEPDWLARGVAYLDQHPAVGSYGGKILRYQYSTDELKDVRKSGIIDSAGLQVFRSRHAIDRGSGQNDHGQFGRAESVFGQSGACVLLRRTALESIRWQQEYLDEDFFAYKDDLDLAWRLQRRGWESWYDPAARAYHHREIRGLAKRGNLALARNQRRRQALITLASYRNHLSMLVKHETWATLWRDSPWIGWYEVRKFGWLLLTQPVMLTRALRQAIRVWPRMRTKARDLNRNSRRSPLEVRQWFMLP